MKRIITPNQDEEALFFSDFTGKPVGGDYGPQAELTIDFNYGSKYDTRQITLHLSDDDVDVLINFLNTKTLKKLDIS